MHFLLLISFNLEHSDAYKSSGYDRGHLAAAGNHWRSQESCDETFLLSNIAPQVGVGFNRDKWNELERYARYLTRHHAHVVVVTGPLYLPRRESDGLLYVRYRVLGMAQVAVPTHFFKVLLCERRDGTIDVESFVMPNAPIDSSLALNAFHTPLDTIERSSGMLLFDKLPSHRLGAINEFKSAFKTDRRGRLPAEG